MTTSAARGKGVGSTLGEAYLDFAPKLVRCVLTSHFVCVSVCVDAFYIDVLQGYKYSVFNLVFANNTASVRIWEKLGFQTIGRVPAAAKLANSDELVDALIIGRELGSGL